MVGVLVACPFRVCLPRPYCRAVLSTQATWHGSHAEVLLVVPLFPFPFPRRHDVAVEHVQQLPEPPLASRLLHQRGIRLHPLCLAHGWLMLLGQLSGNGDSVERIDDDPLQAVLRELWHAYLLPFGSAVQLYCLL